MQNLGTSKSEYCAPTVCDFGSAECSRTWCYICIYTVIHTYIYNDNDDDNNSNSNNNNNNNMNMRYTSIYFHINMPSRLAAMEHRSHPRRGCGAFCKDL